MCPSRAIRVEQLYSACSEFFINLNENRDKIIKWRHGLFASSNGQVFSERNTVLHHSHIIFHFSEKLFDNFFPADT